MFDIKEQLKKLPGEPGVYLMKDENDKIIYVGKAISLKNRVRQYFQSSKNHSSKVKSMVKNIKSFEYIITDSELEALILECNLIKKYRPKYNVLLRDDKTYPYVMITVSEDYPRIVLARRMKKDNNKYFGPFTSSAAVKDTIDLLQKMYQIRSCNKAIVSDGTYTADGEYKNIPKINGRPCLYYHIGQCKGPCQGYISKEEYRKNVSEAMDFLNGNYEPIMKLITERMNEAAENLEFETAIEQRELLNSVKQVAQKQKITVSDGEDKDIIGVDIQDTDAVVQLFFVRDGRMIGRDHFFLRVAPQDTERDIVGSFLTQFYAGTPFIPREIMLPCEVEDEQVVSDWLSAKRGGKVYLRVPKKGTKEKLVELAGKNAAMILSQDKDRMKKEEGRTIGAMKEIAEWLQLPELTRVEAYDISNISGFESVGSMVVYERGKPKRSDYRKFKIQTVQGPDDYASMEEVLTRRFSHGLDEQAEIKEAALEKEFGKFSIFPDLIMMDGGRGQVNVALRVLDRLNLKIPVCGMVKDDNHRTRGLYFHNVEIPIDTNSEGFRLITRIQDEAHRFAIEYHRSLRSKEQVHSILDDIEGIGPTRRKSLMRTFQSLEAIREAEVEELKKAPSMNEQSARRVYEFFHKKCKENEE